MGNIDWNGLVSDAATRRPEPIIATLHREHIPTASNPQKYECGEAGLHAVKFRTNDHGDGRAITTEQIVARAGHLIGAPVPVVRLVQVAARLIPRQLTFSGGPPPGGVHHGSAWADGFTGREGLSYLEENRTRFGALDVLYAWIPYTGDHQWIYRATEPHDVLSVDHTPFFPNGPEWSVAGLRAGEGAVARDSQMATLALTDSDRKQALGALAAVTPEDIADVVACPPAEWGITEDDRVALARYLFARRTPVMELFTTRRGPA